MAIDRVSFSIKMVVFRSFVNVDQMVTLDFHHIWLRPVAKTSTEPVTNCLCRGLLWGKVDQSLVLLSDEGWKV